jgi:hypothetical protein
MYGDFFFLERDNEPAVRAEKLAFGETSGRNEAWLRDTLYTHPELLPVREIDPAFVPLIPLCKELRTEAGPLDAAFINPHGRLTLVECKLWRNPEARRKVVAQVLDYARAISRWSYSDLQRQVAAATGHKGNIPYERARAIAPGLQESRFVDDTFNAMRSGRFLLLIAGDGIREDVGAIAELINRNAASGFTFCLVEVALYGLEDGGLIVQPRTIAKTHTIERTVVLVHDPAKSGVTLLDEEAAGESAGDSTNDGNQLGESPKQAEYRTWWTPVLNMQFDDPDQEPPKLYWPNNVRAPLPISKTWLTAYRGGGNGGIIGVFTSGSGQSYGDMISSLAGQRDEILAELPPGSKFNKTTLGVFSFSISKSTTDFHNEDAKRSWISETLNTYVNALRPRIKKLA